MASLDVTQTPNPVPVDTPSIAGNLDTNTGPQASPAAFGPDLNGLAQGLDSANQDVQQTLYRNRYEQKEQQQAQGEVWALGQYSGLAKTWMQKSTDALASGKPLDLQQMNSDYQTQLDQIASNAPNDFARTSFLSKGSSLGLSLYKQNIDYNKGVQIQDNRANAQSAIDLAVDGARKGSMSPQDAIAAIHSIGQSVAPVVPGVADQVSGGSAQVIQAGITNMAQQQGPGPAALAVRGGFGGVAIDPTHRELLATQLDNQQAISGNARVAVAQQNVVGLAQKAAAGGMVSPQDAHTAATELANATTAQPVNTNPPDLVDFLQTQASKYRDLASSITGPYADLQLRGFQQIESQNLSKIVEQRLNVMAPNDQRDQVNKMADTFGPDDPLVRHAAQIAQDNISRLTPGEAYDPAGVAMKNPTVQASLANAQQALQAAGNDPVAQGQAQGAVKTAVEQNFAAQRLLGVPSGQEQVLTKQQAESYGAAADNPADAQKLVTQFQTQYGPDYSGRALQQVFTSKGRMSGSVSLALMNPDSQPLWGAAQFPAEKLADTDPNKIAIAREIGSNSTWNNFWASQQNDLSAAKRRQGMENALPGMAQFFIKQNGMSATEAVDQVIKLSVGNAYTTVPTGGGTSTGKLISLPTGGAPTPQAGSDAINRAQLGMLQLIRQDGIKDTSGTLDAEHLATLAVQNGYWSYDNKTGSMARMYDSALGPKVVTLGNGQPLMMDLKGLMASPIVDTTQPIQMQFPGQVIDAGQFAAYKSAPHSQRLGTDPATLLRSPIAPPDNSPVLTVPADKIPVAPIAKPSDFNQASLDDRLPDNMKGLGPVFEKYGAQYGIDPKLLAAISMHETGRGTSRAFLEGNNAMGVSNSAGPIRFDSAADSIQHQAHTLASSPYYAKFRQSGSISDLGAQYAPIGAENDPRGLNGDWTGGVTKFYDELSDDNG